MFEIKNENVKEGQRGTQEVGRNKRMNPSVEKTTEDKEIIMG